ncbi:hypothetical protein [Salinarchaeum laminariae]|uniref:hypothetical protein n=1 Tax=Salinarchaeum laminariae TaxID=869888 RepID=UPI0020BDA12E|nr:hypothetical protein [Salinarchaeum laminariae]
MSANPASRAFDNAVDHKAVYESDWDDDLGTVRPEAVYSIASERVRSGERTVAHTMQPHYPHICRIGGDVVPVPGGLNPTTLGASQDETPAQNIPYAFFTGSTDVRRARQSYRACTKFAWESALETGGTLAAEGYTVAITADHGELLGEWGLVGHPWRVRIRPLVEVPWIVLGTENRQSETADSVEEKLEALGYVE